jgi:hypothetical protein
MLGVVLALAACDQPPSSWLVRSCAERSGAWRYARTAADVVLLASDEDPLGRPGSGPPERADGPPCLACAKQLLDRRLKAVEFPLPETPGYRLVGRVSLQRDGDGKCDAFRQDGEAITSARYYDLKPPAGYCIGLEQSTPRTARFAAASFSRASDRAQVVELIDLDKGAVLARVVDFRQTGGEVAPRSCRDTPSGAPAADALAFVLDSITAPARAPG